ncbi:MAG TPA: hypothetical protein VMW69_16425 [Spirochaetia bacterium]|nr:hypothetical protein [Spirochaetia bacterium]
MPEHSTVQPPLRYVPPRFGRRLFRLVATIYPLYLRFGLNIRRVEVEGIESLVEHYRLFQEKKIRLIIAFRHPHVDDGAIMAWLLGGMVRDAARREARREKKHKLMRPPFGYFVYDRGAPLWAGAFIGWILPRMGAISVFRGKLDSHGLEEIRSVLLNADQPLAIAPEGAVSYSERYAAPLETGVAHFSFWCVRDLLASMRTEQVIILPITPSYRHGRDAAKGLRKIADFLERECGLAPSPEKPLPERLRVAADALFRMTELFYKRFYPTTSRSITIEPLSAAVDGSGGCPGSSFTTGDAERVKAVVEAALASAERQLGLPSTGEAIPRVRRIEQACWDRIYREDIAEIEALSPLERALADRIALETSLTMRHLQLADIMVYLSELSIPDGASVDELGEAASNLAGMSARLKGGDISSTPRMGSRSISYRVGEPISVSSRWGAYKHNRQNAVDELMSTLRNEFQRLSSLG